MNADPAWRWPAGTRTAPRVAYQGEPGAFGELAVMQHWQADATAWPAPTFADALALLDARRVDFAVMPVWNSSIGDLRETRAMLADHAGRLDVIGEVTVVVDHCLLALPGATLGTIRFVGSHPVALAQCAALFVSRPSLVPCAAHDTAGAARELAALAVGDPAPRPDASAWYAGCECGSPLELAVIASALAARCYGLCLLAESIQDVRENFTRFAVVAPRGDVRW